MKEEVLVLVTETPEELDEKLNLLQRMHGVTAAINYLESKSETVSMGRAFWFMMGLASMAGFSLLVLLGFSGSL